MSFSICSEWSFMAEVTVSNCNEELLNLQAHRKLLDAANQQNPNPKEQLQGKKKHLLEELKSALLKNPNFLGFGIPKIEIIDETILLDSFPVNRKQSNRRASKKIHKNTLPLTVTEELVAAENSDESERGKKKKYSREVMEATRFVNVPEQCKFWNRIYAALQSSFADDYDTLVVSNNLSRQH